MKGILKFVALASCAGLLGMYAVTASAQATRTWVSGVGDDVNPCSRTAPCKTFAGAISKTAVNGTINCLDPGSYGAVTIGKSITIDCTGTMGSILSAFANGVNVNGAGIKVTLRNISIEGDVTGLIGINITNAASVLIDSCRISGFNTGGATGVLFGGTAGGELLISNSTISGNGTASAGGGVVIRPTGGGVRSTINRVEANNNYNGIHSEGAGGGVNLQLIDVVASGNQNVGILSKGASSVVLDRITAGVNGTGIVSDGAASQVLATNSTITGNGTGVQMLNGGNGYTYLTNHLNANGTDGGFPATLQRR